jgi:VWFA-related protein
LGPTTIELELSVPPGRQLARVDVSVDDTLVASLSGPPWEVAWDAGDGQRGHQIVAELFLADGTSVRGSSRTSRLRINQVEEVGLVNLYAVVRDKTGDYVSDLGQEDFEVLENGTKQTIKRFSTEHKRLRVAIVLDTSRTMEGKKLTKAKSAAIDFVQDLQPEDEALVVTFSDSVRTMQDITSSKPELTSAIETTEASGGTALYDAVWRTCRKLRGFDGRRVLVLLSDGRDVAINGLEPGSLHTLNEAVEQALRTEVMIFAIGLGRNLDSELDFYRQTPVAEILRRMAAETGGRALISSGAGELRKAFTDVSEDLRHQYLLAYVSTDQRHDGKWREIQVLTARKGLEVITRRGYYAQTEEDSGAASR